MRCSWLVAAGWGVGLVLLTTLQLIFHPRAEELALLAGSGTVVAILGAGICVTERRGNVPAAPVAPVAPWASVSSVALAVGLGLFVLGWELGAWMMAIGAGVAVLGAGGLIRERRAMRP